jgi:hypothetical protein
MTQCVLPVARIDVWSIHVKCVNICVLHAQLISLMTVALQVDVQEKTYRESVLSYLRSSSRYYSMSKHHS